MKTWLQITSGRGPAECCLAVQNVVCKMIADAMDQKVKVDLLDTIEGNHKGTLKSALLSIEGEKVDSFIASWEGTILWIATSPFRPNHKRKNWYIGVTRIEMPKDESIDIKDIKIETMKASGPGGQHVNKAESAIRMTHLPTGLFTVAQEERSQYLNKKLALARLLILMDKKAQIEKAETKQIMWDHHNELERGNPARVFKGRKFQQIT